MDRPKLCLVIAGGVVGLFATWQAWRFLERHWNDIFALLVLAVVFGGSVAVAIGKAKFKVG